MADSSPVSDFRFSPRPNRAHEIAWRPWGETAFAESRRLGRPILLSLSAVWCHWCHVMDETTYSDPRVIAAVNDSFVPVRVDNDRRPDVNRRYNMGGWPTTVFVTAGGEILTGATYVPPEQMLTTLSAVREYYEANRSALEQRAGRASTVPDGAAPVQAAGGAPGLAAERRRSTENAPSPDAVALAVIRAFDPVYGGFGTALKFPHADALHFLQAYAALGADADPRAATVVHETLTRMARGQVYDRVGQGFFRYATRRDWSQPHYEKMLEDNARLAWVYTQEYAGGGGEFGATAAGIVDYLMTVLWQGDPPTFSGSQDADEAYYAAGAGERSARPAPAVDRTVYTDWNALATRALLRAATVLERAELAAAALACLDYLWEQGRSVYAMAHYLVDGVPGPVTGLLTDQAGMAAALLDAYEFAADPEYLRRAAELTDWVGEHAGAPDSRLPDRLSGEAVAGPRGEPMSALEENALMADVLLRLAVLTGERSYREQADGVLAAWADDAVRHGLAAGPYGLALLRAGGGALHVVVVGAVDHEATWRLHAAALAVPTPLRSVQLLDPTRDAPLLKTTGFTATATPAAFVCVRGTCRSPAHDPAALATRLAAGID
jgi:uncharacterized protein YyaL (SSP411 family)